MLPDGVSGHNSQAELLHPSPLMMRRQRTGFLTPVQQLGEAAAVTGTAHTRLPTRKPQAMTSTIGLFCPISGDVGGGAMAYTGLLPRISTARIMRNQG